MVKSRGITTFILTLSLTTLIITACETQQERTGEATPTPTATITTSPSPGASPAYSPGASPTMGAAGALSPYDREFLTEAARGATLEVQLANLAAQKATSDEVKRYAQRLATDHSQAGQTIRQMASNLKFTLPQDLTPEQRNLVSRLENLSGKAFDRDYIKAMIADHQKDISEYERAASQATNQEIKQFASQALPMLRDHLKQAREIAGKLGVKAE
jgi:putative membrane protein